MSIILDALKKAEKDRHLGELPGLYSPASTSSRSPDRGRGVATRMLWSAIAVTVLLLAITAGWWWAGSDVNVAPTLSLQPPLPSASPSTPAVPRHKSVVPLQEVPVPPPLGPSSLTSSSLTPSPTQPISKMAPTGSAKTASQNTAPTHKTIPIREAASSEKTIALAELSPALQRELPPLVVGGSMYSDSAAERMLLIDKRLLHEGDEIASGLILEKLMPKQAILRFRGTRFHIDF